MSEAYEYESDSSESSNFSSSSDSSDDEIASQASSHHLLSPPAAPPSGQFTGDAPLRLRSASFTSPILRPSSRSGSRNRSRTGSISLDPDAVSIGIASPPSYQDGMANRPRSNPRNRTPKRSTTPVLGPVNRSTIANEERPPSTGRDVGVAVGTSTTARSITPTSTLTSGRPSSGSRSRQQPPSNRTQIVGLGSNLAIGTILPQGSLSALHEQPSRRSTVIHQPKSIKQGPGHRKVRRWNNDKFIGIASDISRSNPQRGMRIANLYAEAEMDRAKYTEPNAPTMNRTIFGTLVSVNRQGMDDDGVGVGINGECDEDDEFYAKMKLNPARVEEIRNRFVDGEVGKNNATVMSESAKERMRRRELEIYKNGKRMMKKNVTPRLLNVVIRACKTSGFTRNVVDAFEKLLVHNLSSSSADSGYSLKDDSDIWKQILVQKPFITRKSQQGSGSGVTIRMLFCDGESKGAFNRLLLHAVAQFHGLETASSTTSKGHRILTVTGLCKGAKFRFLEYVPFDDGRNATVTASPSAVAVSAGEDETAATQLLLDNMAALKVQ